MRWYIIIGTILMAILLTACSVNANAGNSDAETATVKNEDLSDQYTDLVEIIKKAKGTEINLSETTEIILVDGTTGQRIVIDDKDTVKTLVDEFLNTKFTYINEGEESGGYTYRVVFCNNDKTVFDGSFMGDSRIKISSQEFISSEKALNSFKVIKEMFASTDRTSETDSDENNTETQNENTVKEGWQKVEVDPSTGSKKYISLMLPEEWTYEIVNSEDYPISDLLISFYPKDKTDGSISVGYMTGFSVCGTGLEQEEIDFNGYGAWKGTYYNNAYWDFINLKDEYRDCVITNNAGDTWYADFEGVVDEILKTVEFKIPDKLLKDGAITDITVTSLPEGYEYKFSDIAAIQNIREYFDTLHLESEFTENPNEYCGMTWVLKFTYSDQTEETIYHFGNMFVRNANGQWFKMRYDEAEKLDGILADIEIFPLTSSDDKVDRFLELLGEVPYTGYDNDRFYNVSPSELSEKYGFNILKLDLSFNILKLDQSCCSYLMYEDKIYSLESSFGGYGTTSFAVADINKDGLKELYFTYSWGSGIHRSQIGYFDPATKEVICFNYSNTNNDMTFYVDAGTLVVCNAEVRADSFVDIDTICLTKVGELRFEEDQINFVTSEQAASQEIHSMDDKDEKMFVLERPDTNLEFWITENVDNVDFSKYQERYGLMGGTEYYGSDYVPSIDEEGNQLDPEACVLYTVTSYPDYSSQTRHITSIYITDPSINVYGLTVNSTKDEVKSVIESNGFTYQDHGGTNGVLYVKDKVSFFFMEKLWIHIRVKVENENQLVF